MAAVGAEVPGGVVTEAPGSPHLGPTLGGMTAHLAGNRAEVGGATSVRGQTRAASEAETMAGTETAWGMEPTLPVLDRGVEEISAPGGGETAGPIREGDTEDFLVNVTEARQWCSADHEFGVHRLVLSDLIVLSVGLQR